MLKSLKVQGFKSLNELSVAFPRLTVLFGPNAAGKSNLLEAVQALSRIGTCNTLADALAPPIQGYPVESFAFGAGDSVSFSTGNRPGSRWKPRYKFPRRGRARITNTVWRSRFNPRPET